MGNFKEFRVYGWCFDVVDVVDVVVGEDEDEDENDDDDDDDDDDDADADDVLTFNAQVA